MSVVPRRLSGLLINAVIVVLVGCQRPVSTPVPVDSPSMATAAPTAVVEDTTPFALEADFTAMTRDDFEAFGAEPDTWKATAEGIKSIGKPKGYLYSKQPYGNFTLRLDLRYPRPEKLKDETKFKGNTGFLVDITGEHKLWPVCIEVQGKHIQMAAIKENGGADAVQVEDDETARQKARKPVGQWNSFEIVSKDGAISASLNGTPISHSQPGVLKSGLIGIQAEDQPFEVRRLRIRPE